jgi:cell fate regulator YaaT (PSP1 superfamily)
MIEVYGVVTQPLEKMVFYLSKPNEQFSIDDLVLIETDLGQEVGKIVTKKKTIKEDSISYKPNEIIRKLNESDLKKHQKNIEKSKKAFGVCRNKIKEHGLKMKLLYSTYTFDNSKVIFYFTANGRIDFRLLVRDVASIIHTRIELRQIGVRDEMKVKGGIGPCGQVVCCKRFFKNFNSVSLSLAKKQQLYINPSKISGPCGRLLCCLSYETEVYDEILDGIPTIGDIVQIDGEEGTVIEHNIFKRKFVILTNDSTKKEYTFEQAKNAKVIQEKLPTISSDDEDVNLEDLEDED